MTAVDKKLRKGLLDANAVREVYEGSEVVLAKMKTKGRWEYGRKIGKEKVSKVSAGERMNRKEVQEKYNGRYPRN